MNNQLTSKRDIILRYIIESTRPRKDDLGHLDQHEVNNKNITKRTKVNKNTVRSITNDLRKEKLISKISKGGVNYWTGSPEAYTKRDFLPNKQDFQFKPLIHSVMMSYRGPTSGHGLLLGSGGMMKGIPFGSGRKIALIRVYPNSMNCWTNFSGNPLNGDEFLFFLDFLQEFTGINILRGRGLDNWRICQYALGTDLGVSVQENSVNIRLKDFGNDFLEYYDKVLDDGSTVRRVARHENPGTETRLSNLSSFLEMLAAGSITQDRNVGFELGNRIESLEGKMTELIGLLTTNKVLDNDNSEGMFK